MLLGIGAMMLATKPVIVRAVDTLPGTAPGLPYSKGFLVTGGYAIGSVDLHQSSQSNGFLSGTINMSGVPANADILAAYLYWQTTVTNGTQVMFPKFRDQQIESAKETVKVLDPSIAPCYSGGSSNNSYIMYAFRADVLRLLPSKLDANGVRVLVNDTDLQANGQTLSTVLLPDSGSGNGVPNSAGASLFIVYRDPVSPLTSISVYDGLSVQPPGVTTTHAFAGYLRASANPTARMTQIVSGGANNSSERVFFGDMVNPLATNPFAGGGPSSDRTWSTVTWDVSSRMNLKTDAGTYGDTVTTKIDHTSTSPYECLAWSAMILSTTVADADQDGLPDRLEDQYSMRSPDDKPLPDLHGMLASSQHKDIFIEMGALKDSNGFYDSSHHNHLPTPAVLKLVGDAYKNAPIPNADGIPGIRAHFDVGNSASYAALGAAYGTGEANAYLVPDTYASGGELITEVADPNGQFAGFPGTVSWKIGYQLLRDAPENPDGSEMSLANMEACNTTQDCRRRFDQNRMNFFHYVLYAHYRGKPQDPCVTGDAAAQAACKQTAAYHTPSTASGIADLPGADAMVTLGGWGNGFVGSDFIRASTTLHELGHTTWLTHGGDATTITEPNCKPNYLSIMNYLFQLGGLRDEDGTPHLDYSVSAIGTLNENSLAGDPLNPYPLQYRTAWYAPNVPGSLPYILGSPIATRYCNGAKFPWTGTKPAGWVDYSRVDGYSATLAGIDWSAGLNTHNPQDVNYDGTLQASLNGFNDWSRLRLDQVGSRRNMGGFSLGIDMEFGVDVSGGQDLWGVDVSGGVEWGVDVSGGVDFFGVDVSGGTDFGGDLDYRFGVDVSGGIDDPVFGVDVSGGVDLFGVDVSGGREVDREIATALGNAPPNNVKACVLGTVNCPQGAGEPLHRVKITWKAPNVGTVSTYSVYRVQGSSVSVSSVPVAVTGTVVSAGGQFSMIDPTELPQGVSFTYFVMANFSGGTKSSPSNFSTITAVNDAPTGTADTFTFLFNSTANTGSVLGNDADADSASANGTPWINANSTYAVALVSGPTNAATGGFSFNATNGTFTYTPKNGFTGTDSFKYKVSDGTWTGTPNAPMSAFTEVTVTINIVKKK